MADRTVPLADRFAALESLTVEYRTVLDTLWVVGLQVDAAVEEIASALFATRPGDAGSQQAMHLAQERLVAYRDRLRQVTQLVVDGDTDMGSAAADWAPVLARLQECRRWAAPGGQ